MCTGIGNPILSAAPYLLSGVVGLLITMILSSRVLKKKYYIAKQVLFWISLVVFLVGIAALIFPMKSLLC